MITSRRTFFTGLAATLVTAPAIVRFSSLMPVKVMPTEAELAALLKLRIDAAYQETLTALKQNLYGELTRITREALIPRLWQQDVVVARFSSKWPEI